MFNVSKRLFFSRLILSVVAVSFFAIANAAMAVPKQEVYLSEEPLPKIAARLKDQGMSQRQIVKHLKSTLPKINSQLAKEKFGITWIDNQLRAINNYPAVAICYMGSEVGYGLFALDRIEANSLIAEYTGKHIKDERSFTMNSYIAEVDGDGLIFEKIDAEHDGNAARFANHLLFEDDLVSYRYDFSDGYISESDLAIANSGLMPLSTIDDRHSVLVAIRDINLFEQIGFSYGNNYGYEHSAWPQEPYLFDKNGDIIPSSQYKILNKGIRFADELNNKSLLFILTSKELKLWTEENIYLHNDYVILNTGRSDMKFAVVDLNVWKEQLSKPVNRLSVPCYLMASTESMGALLYLLEKMDKLAFSKEKRSRFLTAARDSGYDMKKLQGLVKNIDKEDL
ncbi:MAG: SET domain-containing protein-lysine N-methyltransferase [bacterium]